MLSRCPRCSTASHGSSVSLHDLNLFKFAFNVNKNWEMDALQFIRWSCFLLAVVVEGDESSWPRIANWRAVLAVALIDSPASL